MTNSLLVRNVEKDAKKEKRLQLAKVGGLFLANIAIHNISLDLSLGPQLLSFYTLYEIINYIKLKGKNDYIIKEEKNKSLRLKKGD